MTISIFLVPVLFVVVERLVHREKKQKGEAVPAAGAPVVAGGKE